MSVLTAIKLRARDSKVVLDALALTVALLPVAAGLIAS